MFPYFFEYPISSSRNMKSFLILHLSQDVGPEQQNLSVITNTLLSKVFLPEKTVNV